MERATATNLAVARLIPLFVVLRWDGGTIKTLGHNRRPQELRELKELKEFDSPSVPQFL